MARKAIYAGELSGANRQIGQWHPVWHSRVQRLPARCLRPTELHMGHRFLLGGKNAERQVPAIPCRYDGHFEKGKKTVWRAGKGELGGVFGRGEVGDIVHPNLPVFGEQGHGHLAVGGVVDDEVGWVLVLHFSFSGLSICA
jgi:hypothetical protein